MTWEAGQSGNPQGSQPRAKRFLQCLERAINEDDGKRLRAAAEKLLDLAAAGEYWAVQMLADRLDGKPVQQVGVSDSEGRPLTIGLIDFSALVLDGQVGRAPAIPIQAEA